MQADRTITTSCAILLSSHRFETGKAIDFRLEIDA